MILCWKSFYIPVGHLYVFFGEICSSPLSIFKLGYLFLCYYIEGVSYIFLKLIPYLIEVKINDLLVTLSLLIQNIICIIQ